MAFRRWRYAKACASRSGVCARRLCLTTFQIWLTSTSCLCPTGEIVMTHDNASAPFSISKELNTLPSDARAVCEYNLGELAKYLSNTSQYALRDDSRLAFRYATGCLPPHWNLYAVAHEIACTQYLCDQVPYQSVQQEFLRALTNTIKAQSEVSWKVLWTAVADLGPDIAKLLLMEQHGLIFPDFAPAKDL